MHDPYTLREMMSWQPDICHIHQKAPNFKDCAECDAKAPILRFHFGNAAHEGPINMMADERPRKASKVCNRIGHEDAAKKSEKTCIRVARCSAQPPVLYTLATAHHSRENDTPKCDDAYLRKNLGEVRKIHTLPRLPPHPCGRHGSSPTVQREHEHKGHRDLVVHRILHLQRFQGSSKHRHGSALLCSASLFNCGRVFSFCTSRFVIFSFLFFSFVDLLIC